MSKTKDSANFAVSCRKWIDNVRKNSNSPVDAAYCQSHIKWTFDEGKQIETDTFVLPIPDGFIVEAEFISENQMMIPGGSSYDQGLQPVRFYPPHEQDSSLKGLSITVWDTDGLSKLAAIVADNMKKLMPGPSRIVTTDSFVAIIMPTMAVFPAGIQIAITILSGDRQYYASLSVNDASQVDMAMCYDSITEWLKRAWLKSPRLPLNAPKYMEAISKKSKATLEEWKNRVTLERQGCIFAASAVTDEKEYSTQDEAGTEQIRIALEKMIPMLEEIDSFLQQLRDSKATVAIKEDLYAAADLNEQIQVTDGGGKTRADVMAAFPKEAVHYWEKWAKERKQIKDEKSKQDAIAKEEKKKRAEEKKQKQKEAEDAAQLAWEIETAAIEKKRNEEWEQYSTQAKIDLEKAKAVLVATHNEHITSTTARITECEDNIKTMQDELETLSILKFGRKNELKKSIATLDSKATRLKAELEQAHTAHAKELEALEVSAKQESDRFRRNLNREYPITKSPAAIKKEQELAKKKEERERQAALANDEHLKECILESLALHGPSTTQDIMRNCPYADFGSSMKVSSLLRQLKSKGRVVSIEQGMKVYFDLS